ncbi:MAG: hypothetical protein Ct9H300mP6_16440 [Gammaproteobacteria bacterium]|nr:MAG: hypothetical protein Ct9H300mP6_16440 [Gammaproteobacteria bacterium]
MLPLELIIRALGIVFSLGILAFAIVLGGVIFISLAGVIVLIMIGFIYEVFFIAENNIQIKALMRRD